MTTATPRRARRKTPAGEATPRQSLSRRLVRELSASIASGEIPVGEKLPTEQALCDAFGVSRTVVREAISSLRADGLVASHQGKGVFVLVRARPEGFQIDRSELEVVQEVIKASRRTFKFHRRGDRQPLFRRFLQPSGRRGDSADPHQSLSRQPRRTEPLPAQREPRA